MSDAVTKVLALGLMLAFAGMSLKSCEAERLRADLTAARAKNAHPSPSAKIEADLREALSDLETRTQEAQAHVKAAPDPLCQNPDPLIDAWRAGIDQLRPQSAPKRP